MNIVHLGYEDHHHVDVDVDVDVDHQWLESDTQSSETLLAAHPLALRLGCGL